MSAMDLVDRVQAVVVSTHPGSSCVERVQAPVAGILDGVAYQFLTADYRVVYAWIAVNAEGVESVTVSNGPPK